MRRRCGSHSRCACPAAGSWATAPSHRRRASKHGALSASTSLWPTQPHCGSSPVQCRRAVGRDRPYGAAAAARGPAEGCPTRIGSQWARGHAICGVDSSRGCAAAAAAAAGSCGMPACPSWPAPHLQSLLYAACHAFSATSKPKSTCSSVQQSQAQLQGSTERCRLQHAIQTRCACRRLTAGLTGHQDQSSSTPAPHAAGAARQSHTRHARQ